VSQQVIKDFDEILFDIAEEPINYDLDINGDADQDTDPRFLNPNTEICYCPAWMIILSVEDISSLLICLLIY